MIELDRVMPPNTGWSAGRVWTAVGRERCVGRVWDCSSGAELCMTVEPPIDLDLPPGLSLGPGGPLGPSSGYSAVTQPQQHSAATRHHHWA